MKKLIILCIATFIIGCAVGNRFLVGEETVQSPTVGMAELKRRLDVRGWTIDKATDTYIETTWRNNVFSQTTFTDLEVLSKITVRFTVGKEGTITVGHLKAYCASRKVSLTSKSEPWVTTKCKKPYSRLAAGSIESLLK